MRSMADHALVSETNITDIRFWQKKTAKMSRFDTRMLEIGAGDILPVRMS
jgi:hypothetical protein